MIRFALNNSLKKQNLKYEKNMQVLEIKNIDEDLFDEMYHFEEKPDHVVLKMNRYSIINAT